MTAVAPSALRRPVARWFGLTDLMGESLCLLHWQSNGSLPAWCDCAQRARHRPLGHWVETRSQKREPAALPPALLAAIDAHTAADARLFAAALKLLLGRLRRLEELTGAELLRWLDWEKLRRTTEYVPGLWAGPDGLVGS